MLPAFHQMAHGHELRTACQYGLAAATFATEQSVSSYLNVENMTAFIESITQQALAEAKENGSTDQKVTPFLLGSVDARIKELTAGKNLTTNIALVYHNAEVATKITVAYNKIVNE